MPLYHCIHMFNFFTKRLTSSSTFTDSKDCCSTNFDSSESACDSAETILFSISFESSYTGGNIRLAVDTLHLKKIIYFVIATVDTCIKEPVFIRALRLKFLCLNPLNKNAKKG